MRGFSLVAASGGHSSSRCAGLSLSRPLLLRSTGSRHAGSVIVAHGPSCSVACGIFPDQGSNPCLLHWQADSQPLRHQGSPCKHNFYMHWANKEFVWLALMWHSLYCSGLKPNPQSLPRYACVIKEHQCYNHINNMALFPTMIPKSKTVSGWAVVIWKREHDGKSLPFNSLYLGTCTYMHTSHTCQPANASNSTALLHQNDILTRKPSKIFSIPISLELTASVLSFTASGNAKWYSHFGTQFGSFLQN